MWDFQHIFFHLFSPPETYFMNPFYVHPIYLYPNLYTLFTVTKLSQSSSAPVCLSLHYTSQDPLVSTPVLTPTIIHLFVIIICVTCLHLISVHLYLYLVLSIGSVRVGQCWLYMVVYAVFMSKWYWEYTLRRKGSI